jgi:hypothetical protein
MRHGTSSEILEDSLAIDGIRDGIRANRISFPAPVPVFARQYRADIQWRLVQLYFVHGWSPASLAKRYNVTSRRVRQSLHSWVCQARTLGYLQSVPPQSEDLSLFQPVWPQNPPVAAAGVSSPSVSGGFIGGMEQTDSAIRVNA